MGWSETNRMDERARFAREAMQGSFSMSELCYRYGISRKTGYKWIERYHQEGLGGCADRSRAPKAHPNTTPEEIARRIIRLRKQHRSWGPRTLHVYLLGKDPGTKWPSPSTIGEILKRNGLVGRRRRRAMPRPWRTDRTEADQPNRVWTADFKGQFRMRNGVYCYPLTIVDAHSRYLLACRGLSGTGMVSARRVFEETFRAYGLPEVIHTDNGVPFCGPSSILRLSRLSVWLLKLGITLERSRPGKPQDNGSHERMHRTLKQEAARPPRANASAQQRALNQFRRIYNEERPHHALEMRTPSSIYRMSERSYSGPPAKPEYPSYMEVRRVSKIGVFTFRQKQIFITEALAGESVGLEAVADGLWSVFFGKILLGRFGEADYRFIAGMGA
jgi:transposase InsO family protein